MEANNRRSSLYIVVGVGALFIGLLLWQMLSSADADIIAGIETQRKQRDTFLQSSQESPVPEGQRAAFQPLKYYPINLEYRIIGDFIPMKSFSKVVIRRTGGDSTIFIYAGKVQFAFEGKTFELSAYQTNEKNSRELFIPFRDKTNGSETYGGGRYLDASKTTNKVILDFNTAYHPYCVYNMEYTCPIPPPENTLDARIEAGERL